MQGLIVAAGQGTRLRAIAPCKPLAMVRGRPLIEHAIEAARMGGVRDFVVVTGYRGEALEEFLQGLASSRRLSIRLVRNPDWHLANGHSVVAARPLLQQRFVLMMADHLFDPALLADLLAARADADVLLAVDRRLDNPLVDLADVTRVRTRADGAITAIGKLIEPYDAFDTGVFLASTALIDAIGDDIAGGGAGSISAGMTRLAERDAARAFDIGDRFWLDVDDPTDYRRALGADA